ncbi:MAG: hypothetical protein LBJ25_04085 [Candidatus Margulisbacteria bacterium]|jgi:hypothetical protein|nr:hypothetical protein [Candidatus Margulisiibacteriota bacterium]
MYGKILNFKDRKAMLWTEQYKELAEQAKISAVFNRYNVDTAKIMKIEQQKCGFCYYTEIFFAEPIKITFASGQTLLIDRFTKLLGRTSFHLVPQTVQIASGETVEISKGCVDLLHDSIDLEIIKPTEIHAPFAGDTFTASHIWLYPDFRLESAALAAGIINIHLPNGNILYVCSEGCPDAIYFYSTGNLKGLNLRYPQYQEIHLADGTTKRVRISHFSLDEAGTKYYIFSPLLPIDETIIKEKYGIENIYRDASNI